MCEVTDNSLDAPKSRVVERAAAAHGTPVVDIKLPHVDLSALLGCPVVMKD